MINDRECMTTTMKKVQEIKRIINEISPVGKPGETATAIQMDPDWVCDDGPYPNEPLIYHFTIVDGDLHTVVHGINSGYEYSAGIKDTEHEILIGNLDIDTLRWGKGE